MAVEFRQIDFCLNGYPGLEFVASPAAAACLSGKHSNRGSKRAENGCAVVSVRVRGENGCRGWGEIDHDAPQYGCYSFGWARALFKRHRSDHGWVRSDIIAF